MNSKKPTPSFNEILLYHASDGKFQIALNKDSESIWLNLNQLAELYQTSIPNISMHIRNILKDGELDPVSTVKDYLTVQTKSKMKTMEHETDELMEELT